MAIRNSGNSFQRQHAEAIRHHSVMEGFERRSDARLSARNAPPAKLEATRAQAAEKVARSTQAAERSPVPVPGSRDEFVHAAPASAPASAAAPGAPAPGGTNFKEWKAPTGYDYSNWLDGGAIQHGSRPPAKTDWDQMPQGMREQLGVGSWAEYSKLADAWKDRFAPGGDIHGEHMEAGRAIMASGAKSWPEVEQVLKGLGYEDTQDGGRSFLRQLSMIWQGNADPSGQNHWTGSKWVDVGTSDLAKRGISSDYTGPRLSGMEAIIATLPGMAESTRFNQWRTAPAGTTSASGLKLDSQTGFYTDSDRKNFFDAQGYRVDPSSGRILGHYIRGDVERQVAGAGGLSNGNRAG